MKIIISELPAMVRLCLLYLCTLSDQFEVPKLAFGLAILVQRSNARSAMKDVP